MSIMKHTTTTSQQKPILESEPLTEEEKREYKEAFTLFDRDGDTLINFKEISLLIRSLEHDPSDDEIEQLIDYIIREGTNLIDCDQFLTMMSILQKRKRAETKKELTAIFSAIDTDSNGLIDSKELEVAMRLLMNGPDDTMMRSEEVDEMIAEVDGDKDGRLTLEEFISIFAGQS